MMRSRWLPVPAERLKRLLLNLHLRGRECFGAPSAFTAPTPAHHRVRHRAAPDAPGRRCAEAVGASGWSRVPPPSRTLLRHLLGALGAIWGLGDEQSMAGI